MKTSSSKSIAVRDTRRGFTLVELLLVVAIIAVLTTMAVGIIASSQHDARVAATRSRVSIIDRIIQSELENYEFRRSPVPERVLIALTSQLVTTNGWDMNRFLIHFRNLRRMINADLIRTEMPSGLGKINNLGIFPSSELSEYLNSVSVPTVPTPGMISLTDLARFRPAGVRRWANWAFDPNIGRAGENMIGNLMRDGDQTRSDSAELLYNLLGQIEFNGTAARDALGSSAFGDADGDGQLEVVDAFGEPIGFQFLQEHLTLSSADVTPSDGVIDDVADGAWDSDNQVAVLDVVDNDPSVALDNDKLVNAVRPIRPDQIRGFFSSSTLDEINGETEGPLGLVDPDLPNSRFRD